MDIMALVRLAGGIMFTPLSDDVLMMSFAALRLREGMYPVVIWLTAWPIFFIAFTWFYLLARFFREIPLVKRWMKSRFLERAETIIERRGLWAIGLSFFLPGVRHPIHYVAGLLGYPLPRYLVMTFLAAGVYRTLDFFDRPDRRSRDVVGAMELAPGESRDRRLCRDHCDRYCRHRYRASSPSKGCGRREFFDLNDRYYVSESIAGFAFLMKFDFMNIDSFLK